MTLLEDHARARPTLQNPSPPTMKSHRTLPTRALKPSPPRKDETNETSVSDASSTPTTASVQTPPQPHTHNHTKPKPSKRDPASRSTNSSAPVMRLPAGHKTDHWSWSLTDPAFRVGGSQPHASISSHNAEPDNLFLFPMGSGSLQQTPSPLTTLPSSYLEAKRAAPNDTTTPAPGTDPAPKQPSSSSSSPPQKRPPVTRTRSYTPASWRSSGASTAQQQRQQRRPVRRAQSITVASMKAARRRHYTGMHGKGGEEADLRRQVADLTQRVTMLLANQCAACRLGIIECGLAGQRGGLGRDGEEKGEGEGALSDFDEDFDEMGEMAEGEGEGTGGNEGAAREMRGRDREREAQIEGQLARLARQARMVAYG